MTRRMLALGLIALGLLLVGATTVSTALAAVGAFDQPRLGVADAVGVLFLAIPGVAFFSVGAVLSLRRTENPVGWLCLNIGLLWFLVGAADRAGSSPSLRGMFESAPWLEVLGAAWVPAVGLMATHLPLRLPDGELLSPRWRWYSRLCTVLMIIAVVIIGAEEVNSFSSPLVKAIGSLFFLFPVSFVGAIGSLVVRYRRSSGVQRVQLKTIAFAGVVFLVCYVVGLITNLGFGEDSWISTAVSGLVLAAYASIPVAIGIAVLRYRLYEIDTVINRALVYGGLTATLAVAYVSCVLLLGLVLRPLTDSSNLAVAGSTLAVAGLFRPVRARIQSAVDRRFFRSRYDAARTLRVFGSRLREQVDVEALRSDLREVVHETVAPTHVSLWLRS